MLGGKKRVRTIAVVLVVLQAFLFLTYRAKSHAIIRSHADYLIQKLNTLFFNDEELNEFNMLDKPTFFENVFDLFYNNPPKKTQFLKGPDCKLDTTSIDVEFDEPKFTEDFLSDCLKISYDVYDSLISSHSKVVSSIPKTFPKGFYEGNGVVMVGGGRYGMFCFLVIKQLRDLGSRIPVQVFIPDHYEDEREYCENILPLVNATCITSAPLFTPGGQNKRQFERFQLKMLLILSSSFENVLFLDSDSFALKTVDYLFETEPFLSTGLVIWPDFWRRSTSPAYYKIAGKNLGKRVRNGVDSFTNPSFYSTGYEKMSDIPLHDRENSIPDGSSEAGEILINKYKHLSTLLLSLYYNTYGPDFYYAIFTQWCYGQGDKETFIAAAHTLNNPYYQIKRKCEQIGDITGELPKLTGMGLLQFSPVKDYEIAQDLQRKLAKNPKLSTNQDGYDKSYVPRQFQIRNQDLLFLHSNHGPKFDPTRLINENKEHRRFGTDMTKIGFDFEAKQFETLKEFVCDRKLVFTNLREGVNIEQLCEYIVKQVDYYESTKSTVKFSLSTI